MLKHKLVVEHIPPLKWWRRTQWKLVEPLRVGGTFVPTGFITDGISTPWLLSWLVSPTGKAMPAAVLHDYLLSKLTPSASRKGADMAFYVAMKSCGIKQWRRLIMYNAVRVYGMAKVGWWKLWH